MIQSFAPGEVTPEQAMQIGEELCDRYLKGDYQYVIAVHHDKSHLHCHIIFNNTNLYNGLSFTTEHNQGRKSERAWAELREISDEICAEHGLSVIEPIGKGVSHYENEMQKEGKSWKEKLRVRIAEVMLYSRDFADFLRNCTASGTSSSTLHLQTSMSSRSFAISSITGAIMRLGPHHVAQKSMSTGLPVFVTLSKFSTVSFISMFFSLVLQF